MSNTPWLNEDGSTNVDGFLAAYEANGNTFWRVEIGHIQNVVDTLIERLEVLTEPDRFCHHRWKAPRPDTVYESMPVEHVCELLLGHHNTCACSCGAVYLQKMDQT